MKLLFEVEGGTGPTLLPGDGAELAAFMSFACMRGFGAQHPLLALADRLHENCGVRLGPLTTFYDATIEDAEDREKLELAWQEAEPLARTLAGMAETLANDAQAQALVRRAGSERLEHEVRALIAPVEAAAASGARVRLSYVS